MKYLIPIFLVASFLLFLSFPMIAMAVESTIGPIHPHCTKLFVSAPSKSTSAMQLCSILFRVRDIIYYIGWGIALIMLIIGGIMYMTAGGQQEKVDKAKKLLTYAIIGAAIILAAGLILGAISQIIFPTHQTGVY